MTEEIKSIMSESIAELATALSKAQGGFNHAKKDADNPFFKSKYADLATCIDAAKEQLAKNGLSVCQLTQVLSDGRTTLVSILAHSSGQWIKGEYLIKPVKDDPQGMGSAITYARRYCFSAITGIASEDDDGNSASGKDVSRAGGKQDEVFKNASMRKSFVEGVIKEIESSESIKELNLTINNNLDKIKLMGESANEHDTLAREEINNRYKRKLAMLEEDEKFKKLQEDFKERA